MSELTLNMQADNLIKMLLETNNYTAVDIIRDMQKRIAELDRQSEKCRDDIASWQRVHRAEYEKREALEQQLKAAMESADAATITVLEREKEIAELKRSVKTAKAQGVMEARAEMLRTVDGFTTPVVANWLYHFANQLNQGN